MIMFGKLHTFVCLKNSLQQKELRDLSGNYILIESCGVESQGQE